MKVLVTCPPMLGLKEQFIPLMQSRGLEPVCPNVVQTLSEDELCELLPQVDGWIIGDDPATEKVFTAGREGKLKAAVKWGIGTDNVDFEACERMGIPITNTPGMFGQEVADIALGYVIALARETFAIDRGVRNGEWPKHRGISLAGKTAGIVGYGDIGSQLATRLRVCGMNVITWDPAKSATDDPAVELHNWPEKLDACDFLVFTCGLNKHNFHMLDTSALDQCKQGVRVVNVARGPLIDEQALTAALVSGKVHSAALDVFEVEPLPADSKLRTHPLCILGSHNGSNTTDAVMRTNSRAIEQLCQFLGVN